MNTITVNFKDILNNDYPMQCRPNDTIEAVKLRLAELLNCSPANLFLLHLGQNLQDTILIKNINLQEKPFIVIHKIISGNVQQIPQNNLIRKPNPQSHDPPDFTQKVKQILDYEMGFSEDRIKYALKQTKYNVEQAVDYLLEHPDELSSSPVPQPPPVSDNYNDLSVEDRQKLQKLSKERNIAFDELAQLYHVLGKNYQELLNSL